MEGVTFAGGERFCVFRLQPERETTTVTVTGRFAAPLVGELLRVQGDWAEHPRFGRQFQAIRCQRLAPTGARGIERFLASGAVRGIRASMAARMVARFGTDTLKVIEQSPRRLLEVEGIGEKRAAMIHESYTEQSELRELMLFLETCGVSGSYAGKLYARYGFRAQEVLKENPYQLAAEVDGIGFRTADQMARALGFELNHPDRLAAGVQFALLQIAQNGHCCMPEQTLITEAARLLTVNRGEVAAAVRHEIAEVRLRTEEHGGDTLLYPVDLYRAECQVASRLLEIKQRARPLADEEGAGLWLERWGAAEGLVPAAAQRQALQAALEHGVLVLTGGPGTGKTTTIKGILALLEEAGLKILLGAPTGRAAKRLAEATGHRAMTVHRLLEAGVGEEGWSVFGRDEDNLLETDALIIDEASMMDIVLMRHLLTAVPDGCRVILTGDVDQLPAVGPGSVLKDVIRSGVIPVVRLTEVFRQAEESMIVWNAHSINRGRLPDCDRSRDFQFREEEDAGLTAQAVVALYEELRQEGFDVVREVQVLSPMHRQECGVENLNRLLQAALNPPAPGKDSLNAGSQTFRVEDKVMQIRNNYSKRVFNGDVGFIRTVEEGRLLVRYPEEDVLYDQGEHTELTLAYAMSVHKSQGSEYPVIIMPLTAGHRMMLQRSLLYTAVTRAKERVVLLGAKGALATAVGNDRTRRRYSLLAERLRQVELC